MMFWFLIFNTHLWSVTMCDQYQEQLYVQKHKNSKYIYSYKNLVRFESQILM